MKNLKKVMVAFSVVIIVFLIGCGTSTKKKIRSVSRAVDSLKAVGIPDSLITDIEVAGFDAKTQFEKGSKGKAEKIITKALRDLQRVKNEYARIVEEH